VGGSADADAILVYRFVAHDESMIYDAVRDRERCLKQSRDRVHRGLPFSRILWKAKQYIKKKKKRKP